MMCWVFLLVKAGEVPLPCLGATERLDPAGRWNYLSARTAHEESRDPTA
jgi:hypothetical protein